MSSAATQRLVRHLQSCHRPEISNQGKSRHTAAHSPSSVKGPRGRSLNAAIKICIEGDSVCTRYVSVQFSLRQVLKEGSSPGLARFHHEHSMKVLLFEVAKWTLPTPFECCFSSLCLFLPR